MIEAVRIDPDEVRAALVAALRDTTAELRGLTETLHLLTKAIDAPNATIMTVRDALDMTCGRSRDPMSTEIH